MIKEKIRVLLVDDHLKIVRFIELRLRLDGFETAVADSGQRALEKVKSNGFDVMLLDIKLGDIDGFEVLRQLRKFSKLPVIAYSATPEYDARALECGANLFMAKPFDMDQLIEKILQLTNK